MSWFSSASEWKQGLSTTVLNKIDQLEIQTEKLMKERTQRQNQLDSLQQALEKQKLKNDEEIKQKQIVQKELEHLSLNYDQLQAKYNKVSHDSTSNHSSDVFSLDSSVEKTLRRKISELERINKDLVDKQSNESSKDQDPFWSHFSRGGRDAALPKRSPFKANVRTAIETSEENPFRAPITPHKKGLEISEGNPFRTPLKYSSSFSSTSSDCLSVGEIAGLEKRLEAANKQIEELKKEKLALISSSVGKSTSSPVQDSLLESSRNEASKLERELIKAKEELNAYISLNAELNLKVEKLEARIKTCQSDADCLRQNADAAKHIFEEKTKRKEKEFSEETSRLQSEISSLDAKVRELTTRSQQRETLAMNEQNILQANLDKVAAQLCAAEKEKISALTSSNQIKIDLERLQKSEEDQKRLISAYKQDKDMMMAQIETLKVKLSDSESSSKRFEAKSESLEQAVLALKADLEDVKSAHKSELNQEIEARKSAQDRLLNEKNALEKSIAKREEEATAMAEKMASAEREKEDALREMSEVRANCETRLAGVHELDAKISQLESDLSAVEASLSEKELEWKEKAEQNAKAHQDEVKELKRSLDETSARSEAALADLRAVCEEQKEASDAAYRQKSKDLEGRVAASEEGERTAREEKLAVEVRLWELEGELERASSSRLALEKSLAEAETQVGKLREELRAESSELEEKASSCQTLNENLQKASTTISSLVSALEEWKSKLVTNEEKLTNAQKENKNLSKQLEEKRTNITNLEKEKDKLTSETEAVLQDRSKLVKEIQGENSDLKLSLDTSQAQIEKLTSENTELKETEKISRAKIDELAETIRNSSVDISQLKSDLENTYEKLSQESAVNQQRMDEWAVKEELLERLKTSVQELTLEKSRSDERFDESQQRVAVLEEKLRTESESCDKMERELSDSRDKIKLTEEELMETRREMDEKATRLCESEATLADLRREFESSSAELGQRLSSLEGQVVDLNSECRSRVKEKDDLFNTLQQVKTKLRLAEEEREMLALDLESYKDVTALLRSETVHENQQNFDQNYHMISKVHSLSATLEKLTKKVVDLQRKNSELMNEISSSNKRKKASLSAPSDVTEANLTDKAIEHPILDPKSDLPLGNGCISENSQRISNSEPTQIQQQFIENEKRAKQLSDQLEKYQKDNFNLLEEIKQLKNELAKTERLRKDVLLEFESYKEVVHLLKLETDHTEPFVVDMDCGLDVAQLRYNIENLTRKVLELEKRNVQLQSNGKRPLQTTTHTQTERDSSSLISEETQIDATNQADDGQITEINNLHRNPDVKVNFSNCDACEERISKLHLLTSQIEALKNESQDKENEVIEIGDKLQDILSDFDKIEKENRELKVRLMNGTLNESLFVDANASLNASLNTSNAADSLRDELNQAKFELQKLKEQRDLDAALAQELEEEVSSLHNKLEAQKSCESTLKKQIDEFKNQVSESTTILTDRKNESKSVAESGTQFPDSEQILAKEDLKTIETGELMQELIVANDRLELKCKNLTEENEELVSSKDSLDARLEAALTQNVYYEREIKNSRERINELVDLVNPDSKQKIADLEDEIVALIQTKDSFEEENATLRNQITHLREKLLLNSNDCNSSFISDSDHSKLQTEVDVLRDLLKKKTKDLEAAEMRMETIMDEVEAKKKEIEAELNELFDARTEEYQEANDRIIQENDVIKSQLESLRLAKDEIEREKLKLIGKIDVLTDSMKLLSEENSALKNDIEKLRREIDEIKTENNLSVSNQNELKIKLDRIQHEKANLESENENLKTEISGLSEKQLETENNLSENVEKLEAQLESLQNDHEESLANNIRLETEKNELIDKINAKDELLTKLEKCLSSLQEQATNLEAERNDLNKRVDELTAFRSETESELGFFGTCVSSIYNNMNEFAAKIDDKTKELDSQTEKLTKLEDKVKIYKLKAEKIQSDRDEYKSQIEKQATDIKELENVNDLLKDENSSLMSTKAQLENQIENVKSENDSLTSEKQKLSEEIADLITLKDQLLTKQTEIDDLKSKLSELDDLKTNMTQIVDDKEKLEKKLEQKDVQISESKAEIESAQEALNNLKAKFVLNQNASAKKEKELAQSHKIVQKLKEEVKKSKLNVKEAHAEAKLRSSESIQAERAKEEWKTLAESKDKEISDLKNAIEDSKNKYLEIKTNYDFVRSKADKLQVQYKNLLSEKSQNVSSSSSQKLFTSYEQSQSSDIIPPTLDVKDETTLDLPKTGDKEARRRSKDAVKTRTRKSRNRASLELKNDTEEKKTMSKSQNKSSNPANSLDDCEAEGRGVVTRSLRSRPAKRSTESNQFAAKKLRVGHLEGLPHKVVKGLNDIPQGLEHDGVVTRPTTPLKNSKFSSQAVRSPLQSLNLNSELRSRGSGGADGPKSGLQRAPVTRASVRQTRARLGRGPANEECKQQ